MVRIWRAASLSHRAPVSVCLMVALLVQGCALPGFKNDVAEPPGVALKSDAPEQAIATASVRSDDRSTTGVEDRTARPGNDPLTIQVSASEPDRGTRSTLASAGPRSRGGPIKSAGWNPVPAPIPGEHDSEIPKLIDPESGEQLVLRRVPDSSVRQIPAVAGPTRSRSERAIRHATFEPSDPAQNPNPQVPPPPQPMPPSGLAPNGPPTNGVQTEPDGSVHIPLHGNDGGDNISVTSRNGKVSLVVRNAPVQSVLNLLAQQQGLNLIAAEDVTGNISVTLTNVAFEDALGSIVAIAGCTWTQQKGIVLVTKIGGNAKSIPGIQGKVVQVYPLNFVSATDIEATVKGLLSPIGQIFISQTTPKDQRRTQELIVIEDLPDSVSRVGQYLVQVDQPPRQVMIEAHVLQVDLKDDTRHGVDWKYITTAAGRDIAVKTAGFTNPLSSPASIFSLSGEHLQLVVEALKTTTDAKTLANPKVIVANGQEARIQIGDKLGYFVTTTTQTSTLQNVNFLNTGVVLRVMPQISNDGRVLMQVKPEISTGKISSLGLPETKTTEAETTVLLEDGGGMVIGGLIRESDTDTQEKVPILGDLWGVGRLFQKRSVIRERNEVIIVLIPRIAPYGNPDDRIRESVDITRTQIPLFKNGLQPVDRSFEPRLPDAIRNPRRFRASRLPALLDNPNENNPKPLRYYFPTTDEEMTPDGPAVIQPVPLPGSAEGPLPGPAEVPPLPPEGSGEPGPVIQKVLPTGGTVRLRRTKDPEVRGATYFMPNRTARTGSANKN